eukprot:TRINITY_DN11537_c0_g1_i1.p1 TRINITY_DN11537_c0_g1~~TRINITY_DN11537_c0_g1_i1.p1  ORF type:complete len:145 (-),score=69.00 TRINITY_DN11537_c0_g1_i1:58-492(-)
MFCIFFFFFKQKTAYEMLRSLVGSEMCIRDRAKLVLAKDQLQVGNQRRDEMEGELIKLRDQASSLVTASPKRGDRSLNVDASFNADDSHDLHSEVEELRRMLALKDAEITMIKKIRGDATKEGGEDDPEAVSYTHLTLPTKRIV